GLLLHFHGNGELAAEYAADDVELFRRMGVNVCFAEYRGYGASTGEPALGAMLGDGERIVRALGVPPERIVAFGRSLGSLYAIELARRLPRLAGLIIESGVADVLELIRLFLPDVAGLGTTEAELATEVEAHFNLKRSLEGFAGDLLILHAAGDRLLNASHARRLHDWAGAREKKLVLFETGDHNSILFANLPAYLREVDAFLRRAGIMADDRARPSP
ncbi:MAG TPA: alpha/beta hydrolase, partial [Isosphaeraceae bacterium]